MTTGELREAGRDWAAELGKRALGGAGQGPASQAPSLVPSTCVEGILRCQEVPGCPGPGVWGSWGPWEDCSVSCGGGEQLRSRRCARPPCPGLARQSRTCHTQVCRGESQPKGHPGRSNLGWIPLLAFDTDTPVSLPSSSHPPSPVCCPFGPVMDK